MKGSRERCEVTFIARIMNVIALNGMRFDTKDEHRRFVEESWQAVMEPVEGLNIQAKEFIRIKVNAMENLTLKPACDKSFAEKILLIGYYFMDDLIEREYIIIPDGSALRRVTDYLLALVDIEDEGTQKRMESAQKQARKWMQILQGKGYFI